MSLGKIVVLILFCSFAVPLGEHNIWFDKPSA